MMAKTAVVFLPAMLCDAALYDGVIAGLGAAIEPQVVLAPRPTLADSVAEVLAQAPPHFALVGTSYGGSLALEVALAAPERVLALWLMGCDPAPPRPGPDLVAALGTNFDGVIDGLAARVVHENPAAAATFRAMAHRVGAAAGADQARALASRPDTSDRLDALTMKTLVLWGEQDALVPPGVGRALATALPYARFHGLEGCGHLPTLERPGEAAGIFAAFL